MTTEGNQARNRAAIMKEWLGKERRWCEQCQEQTPHHVGRGGCFNVGGHAVFADFCDDGPRCVPCTIMALRLVREVDG